MSVSSTFLLASIATYIVDNGMLLHDCEYDSHISFS